MYDLAKAYNHFYHEHSVLKADNQQTKEFRLKLSWKTGLLIRQAMGLLGIEVPERM
ncbi:MAG: DALR anticodon-binding domain-containing protein [Bacteroidota bacterium]